MISNLLTAYLVMGLLMLSISARAQTEPIKGKVIDRQNVPLEGANIIALPKNNASSPQFTITDSRGVFTLELQDSIYELKISYLGFDTKTLVFNNKEENNFTIVLERQTADLDEVVLNYTPEPIQEKPDSIIFNIKDFIDGSEHKLDDILKNLPGVEYQNGKLTINGKDVTQALVEGDKFFSGNTALAAENIPANVVKKIEFIDDYSAVGFLKGVSNSDKIIMNIKLKDPKASFTFGEIDAEYGNSNFYQINPSFFNYSKKESIAVLGASNNTGKPLHNILNLESLEEGNNLINNRTSSSLGRYRFPDKEVKRVTNHAIALGFKNKLSPKTTINSYLIGQDHESERESFAKNQYLNPDETSIETVLQSNTEKSNIYIGNLELTNKASINEETRFSFNVEDLKSNSFSPIERTIGTTSNYLNSENSAQSIKLSNWLGWYKKFSKTHILQFEASISNLGNKKNDGYYSDDNLFAQVFSFGGDQNEIHQRTFRDFTQFNVIAKVNQKLNLHNTLSIAIETEGKNDNFKNHIYGSIQDSLTSNFFDDVGVRQTEFFVKPGYLLKKNRFVVEASFDVRNRQLNGRNRTWVSPFFNIKYKKSIGTEVSLSYEYKDQMSSTKYRYPFGAGTIQSFNSVFYSNGNLESSKYHDLKFGAGYANIFKGFTAYAIVDFQKYDRSVIFDTDYIDKTRILTPINTTKNNYEVFSRMSIGKMFKKFKIRLTPRYKYTLAPQVNNGLLSEAKYNDLSIGVGAETMFNDIPNISVNYSRGYSNLKTSFLQISYNSDAVYLMLSRSKGAFRYKFTYDYYRTSNSFNNDLSQLGFEATYDFEKSPWKISLNGINLLNTSTSSQNILGSTVISERETRILPAMVLLGVVYKI